MKRIFTSLVMLAAVLVGQTVWAQTLSVGGVSVNLNATTTQTITGSNIEGKVTYSPSSKTLYLEGATIRGSISGTGLGSSASTRYYIYLKGSNTLVTSNTGIRFDNSYIVLYGGDGASLYISSENSNADYSCINTSYGHFEVWSIELDMIGASKGFYGTPSSSTLEFVNSIVQVDCNAGAIYGFKNVSFDDCKVTTNDVKFQSGKGYVDSAGNLASALNIWPLLCVGDEPVRTASSTMTGSRYPWTWTKSTKTLELTGSFNAKAYSAIANYGIEGLTIRVDEYSLVQSTNTAVNIEAATNFKGSGSLNIYSTSGNAIVARADVYVSMEAFNVAGKRYAFTDMQSGHKLTLHKYNSNSAYRFAGESKSDIYSSDLIFSSMDISNDNTYWNPNDGYVYVNNTIKKGTITNSDSYTTIKSTDLLDFYGVYVGESRIRANCTDYIMPRGLTSGTIKYEPSSKTLTLTNVTMTNTEGTMGKCIENREVDGLDIRLVGDNTLASRNGVIRSEKSFYVTGDGTLTGTTTSGSGIYIDGTNITGIINGPQLDFTSSSYGLYDRTGTCTLKVKGRATSVTFTPSSNYAAISNLGNLELGDQLAILEPAGGYFSTSLNSITTDGTSVYMDKVVIGQPIDYGIYIGETRVTSANADDILGDGHFQYDASTKTLTVTNATLTNTSGTLGSIINNYNVYGLNINFVGDNTFTSRMSTIDSQKTFVISGNGTLSCTSTNEAGLYLSGDDVVCYIDGPKAVFAGNFGLIDWSRAAKLCVTGSTTRVTFKPDYNYQAILNLGNLLLDYGFSILEPAEGWFDWSLHSVTTDGSYPYTGTVIIGRAMEGDLNGDSKVDIADAVTVLNIMASGVYDSAADLNNDTKVDIADFVTVLNIMAAQ